MKVWEGMQSFLHMARIVLFGGLVFGAGITCQWVAEKHRIYPLTILGSKLNVAETYVEQTLVLAGLKTPRYLYPAAMIERDLPSEVSSVQQGLTLVTAVGADSRLDAAIVEMDGTVVQNWDIDWFEIWPDASHLPKSHLPKQRPGTHIHGAAVMPNGDLVFNFEYLGLVRLNSCGDVVWRLPYQTHHSIDVDETTGHLWVSGRRYHEKPVATFPDHTPPFAEPTAIEVSPDGKIVQEISIMEVLALNGLRGLLFMENFGSVVSDQTPTMGDTLHLNDVEVFPRDLEEGFFKHGDLMVSLRDIHTVFVFEQETKKIKYLKVGEFIGQHDPDFLDSETLSVFDNNVVDGPKASRQSRVVILSALNNSTKIYYQGSENEPFFTDIMGKHQWLDNGNLLLTESTRGRAFEIDREGDMVWQYVNTTNDEGIVGLLDEAQRLPLVYDRAFFEEQRKTCSKLS